MNPNISGFLGLAIFSVGTLLIALASSIPPFQLLTVTFAIGATLLTGFQLARGENILHDWKQPLSDYLFVFLGIGVYTILLVFAFQLAPAFEINILNYLWPIFLIMFSTYLQKTQLLPYQAVGLTLGALGMVAVFSPTFSDEISHSINAGHVCVIAAALCWAFYSAKAKGRNYTAGLIPPVMIISALMCLCLHLLLEETVWPGFSVSVVVILLGFNRVGYALWDYSMKHGNPLLLSSLSYFVPLVSVLLFVLFGFEPANPLIAFGGAMIVLGCLIVNANKLIKLVKS